MLDLDRLETVAWRAEQAARMRQLWAAVALAAIEDARRSGDHGWLWSTDAQRVFALAGFPEAVEAALAAAARSVRAR